jgi:hypothetical protein
MIERLRDVLPNLEYLSPDDQEEAATYIEALVEALQLAAKRDVPPRKKSLGAQWEDPFGAWSDLPDTMLDELDRLRHMSPPTPPLEL